MRKIRSTIALILFCVFFAGCGGQKDNAESTGSANSTGSSESTGNEVTADMSKLPSATAEDGYYDIFVEQEPIFQWEQIEKGSPLAERSALFAGMQFYQGEPVQLWVTSKITGMRITYDLCLYKADGSHEVIRENMNAANPYHGYLDQEGNLYWWYNATIHEYPDRGREEVDGSLKKYLASGELAFERELTPEEKILKLCPTTDGKVYLTLCGAEDRWLAEMDPVNGLITKLCNGQAIAKAMDGLDLGVYGNVPVIWFDRKVAEISTDDGTSSDILSLRGSSYMQPEKYRSLQDFRVLEDGSVEVLWAVSDGRASLQEKLRLAKVEQAPVILRAWTTGSWLIKQVNRFNRQNSEYHVIVENQAEDREDFARLTSVQIASGKGPDILLGGLMEEYIPGMIEKGALEDLRPYMEKSGILEEDYFPYVFSAWRSGEEIFSTCPTSPWLISYRMDSSVLGGMQEPDIETLVNVLLARQEDAVFLDGYDSQALLDLFLKGTDTLWGMVEWEEGNCDFGGELLAGILEMAKRYGDKKGGQERPCIAEIRNLRDVFHLDSLEDRTRDGKVVCGVLFDDGCHAAVNAGTILAINANSSNKDGAWEFISFLLTDKAQYDSEEISVASREAFDVWVDQQKEEVADGREIHEMWRGTKRLPDGSWEITNEVIFSEDDVTEERIEEYLEILEDARTYPLRTAPILEIIKEEAADYFNGSKNVEAVIQIITNRVQLYLDEGR